MVHTIFIQIPGILSSIPIGPPFNHKTDIFRLARRGIFNIIRVHILCNQLIHTLLGKWILPLT